MSEHMRLGRAFRTDRTALVAYVMAGYPDRDGSLRALEAVTDAGADLIELGAPYTDQLADGPVIVNAAEVARDAAGGAFGLAETLEIAMEFRERALSAGRVVPPIALMCYLNPLLKTGLPHAAKAIVAAGVEGVIVPDLPPDMAGPWLAASDEILDTVFLAAPTSTAGRLQKLGALSAGFVYCVATTGVTGERPELPAGLAESVARVRAATSLPVAVGFGVSTPEQARLVAEIADGVVVGSALVRRQAEPEILGEYCTALARAVHASGGSAQ